MMDSVEDLSLFLLISTLSMTNTWQVIAFNIFLEGRFLTLGIKQVAFWMEGETPVGRHK